MDGVVDGYGFVYRFYCGGEVRFGFWEFFECKVWYFCDDIVDVWFKGCRCYFGDVVVEFIQCEVNCQFCGDFGDWEFGCFRSQC